ncbi:MAG TPA: PKD domain-containing protein, partial [Saprospiraceae bacterium]|nr:PKD domain-containing protein [Saprospiraceae bacterium]
PSPADTVLEICKGQSVFFKNESLAADLFEWTFSDDASVETQPNPKHEYNQPGLFSVRLIARTQCLCADTTWLRVRVLDAESPLLNCINTLCPGEVITYSTPSVCATYEWSTSPNGSIIGGGGPLDDSVTVRWMSGPEGTLSLRALGCGGNVCPAVAVVQVPILSDAAEIRGPELVCPDAEEVYQITAFDGANYVWGMASADGSVLEGQGSPKVSVKWGKSSTSPRPLWVEYDNCYLGCKGRDTIWVKISPQFGIVGPVEACDNTVRTFSTKTYDNKNITCEWTLYAPDGSVAHQYTAPNQNYVATFGFGPGTYRMLARPIAAQQQNTCTSEAEWKVLVQANPQKPFGISGQTVFCPSQQLTYTAQGVNPSYDVRWQAQTAPGAPIDAGSGNPKIFAFAGGAGLRWVAAYQVTA